MHDFQLKLINDEDYTGWKYSARLMAQKIKDCDVAKLIKKSKEPPTESDMELAKI